MSKLKKLLVVISLFMPAVVFSTAATQLQNYLSRYQTFSASFTEKTLSSRGALVATSHGSMWLKRPNKFRWTTQTPTHQVIVGDGRYLWIYNVDLMQVTKQKVNKNIQSPIEFLVGSGNKIESQYSITMKNKSNDNQQFTLMPKSTSRPVFTKVILNFSESTLEAMTLTNNLGQTSTFAFSNIKLNKKIRDQLFRFVPPKNVDVINQNV